MTSIVHVDIHPDAVAEAQAALRWYQERSAAAADGYLAELDRAVEAITNNPDMCPQYIHGTRRYIFHRFPFYLVVRKIAVKIEIIAVAHGRRKPGYWKTRVA